MYKTGLVSVTFRKLSPEQIISVAKQAGLEGIEWGGDVHVPSGDISRARRVGEDTREAGLSVISYGSYYRCGQGQDFLSVLDTAQVLGAPNIRLWCGVKGSASTSLEEVDALVEDVKKAALQSADRGITLSFEFHGGTYTDTGVSSLGFMKRLRDEGYENVNMYWQPNQFISFEDNIRDIELLSGYVSSLHVFSWEGNIKYPLEYYSDRWREYLSHLDKSNHSLLLEFVCDETPEQLYRDADALRSIIREA
ncbi:MAG: sugar phosphate isomerase/epimerase family protein [Eubacteriales bacterium]